MAKQRPETEKEEEARVSPKGWESLRGASLGAIETLGLLPMIEAVDAMVKAANVEVIRFQKLGLGWTIACVAGGVGAVRVAMEAGHTAADRFSQEGVAASAISRIIGGPLPFPPVSSCMLARPHPTTWDWVSGQTPQATSATGTALGFAEVLGFVPAVLALDAMLKGAMVSFKGYGGIPPRYVLWVQGDVGAVRQAVDAASKVASEGNRLVLAQVIARPDAEMAETIPAKFELAAITGFALPLPHRLKLLAPEKD